jgi:hypothetical protein
MIASERIEANVVNVDHDMNNRGESCDERSGEGKLRGKETHCRNSFLLCRDL